MQFQSTLGPRPQEVFERTPQALVRRTELKHRPALAETRDDSLGFKHLITAG